MTELPEETADSPGLVAGGEGGDGPGAPAATLIYFPFQGQHQGHLGDRMVPLSPLPRPTPRVAAAA